MSCKECGNYHDLRVPVKVDEANYIYGYCFTDKYNMEKGHAIYVPDGQCDSFKKRANSNYQCVIDPEFKCELCKKELLKKIKKLF